MIYLLDTNTVSDIIDLDSNVLAGMRSARANGDTLGICGPVYYELQRGFLWGNKVNKLKTLEGRLLPLMKWFDFDEGDWLQAARFYAASRSKGFRIDDIDLLIAALADRVGATVVTSDADFNPLPVKLENWR